MTVLSNHDRALCTRRTPVRRRHRRGHRRIDADTLLDPHWCERVEQYIENDPELDAIAGSQFFYELPRKRLQERQRTAALDTYMNTNRASPTRCRKQHGDPEDRLGEGKPHLVGRADLHEDMDLSMALKSRRPCCGTPSRLRRRVGPQVPVLAKGTAAVPAHHDGHGRGTTTRNSSTHSRRTSTPSD